MYAQLISQCLSLALIFVVIPILLLRCGFISDEQGAAVDTLATSLEGVDVGDRAELIQNVLGNPSRVTELYSRVLHFGYGDLGLSLLLRRDPTNEARVASMCAHPPYSRSLGDLAIGTIRAKVLGRYGEPDAVKVTPHEPSDSIHWARYDTYKYPRASVTIEYDKLHHVHSWCIVRPVSDTTIVGTITRELGVITQLTQSEFVIVPVSEPSKQYAPGLLGLEQEIPEPLREDGLPVIFSADVLRLPPNVRLYAMPIILHEIHIAHR